MRYFLEIAYNGTPFCGWQVQPNGNTVQAEINRALTALFKADKIDSMGCGRTDTGVHASQFFVHFDTAENLPYSEENFVFRLNKILPKEIAVFKILPVKENAHARFDATERGYIYKIHRRKNPFLSEGSWLFIKDLDLEKMNEAAALLLPNKDFASFCKTNHNHFTTLCDVSQAEWIRKDSELHFHIVANRFLRNMVRAIVGTLLEVGEGKITLENFKKILEEKNRSAAGLSVPALGLYLNHIKYPYL